MPNELDIYRFSFMGDNKSKTDYVEKIVQVYHYTAQVHSVLLYADIVRAIKKLEADVPMCFDEVIRVHIFDKIEYSPTSKIGLSLPMQSWRGNDYKDLKLANWRKVVDD